MPFHTIDPLKKPNKYQKNIAVSNDTISRLIEANKPVYPTYQPFPEAPKRVELSLHDKYTARGY